MDMGEVVGAVFLDLDKAFDTINHLRAKLDLKFHVMLLIL